MPSPQSVLGPFYFLLHCTSQLIALILSLLCNSRHLLLSTLFTVLFKSSQLVSIQEETHVHHRGIHIWFTLEGSTLIRSVIRASCLALNGKCMCVRDSLSPLIASPLYSIYHTSCSTASQSCNMSSQVIMLIRSALSDNLQSKWK